jgi:prepilin-type N-terminal cleavage/methylation domain-containing protein
VKRSKWVNSRGMTLVEVLSVIVILGILAGIASLTSLGIIGQSREDICLLNQTSVERDYERNLSIESHDHSNTLFYEYVESYNMEICSIDGGISYVDGEVQCSVHDGEEDDVEDQEEEDDSVPFL